MVVAVLAVQGDFAEHEYILEKLGIEYFEIRQKKDLERSFDGLILPGGESTVQGKLLKELEIFEILYGKINEGLPVLGTCAGLILLSEKILRDDTVHFGTLPVTVKRNAYGRQLGSFYTEADFGGMGIIPMTFIRAPYIETITPSVKVLAQVQDKIVGVQYKNQIGISFHPELNDNIIVYQKFIQIMDQYIGC